MFASKKSNGKICKIHFRALQIIYNIYDKSHEELLAFSNDISICQKQLRILAKEVFIFLMKINPDFVRYLYTKISYGIRTGEKLFLPKKLKYHLMI